LTVQEGFTDDDARAVSGAAAPHPPALPQPVVRYQGQVLDGRNRLLACKKAGVDPTFTDHEGDDASALALVISLNAQRRDLTTAQRAIVAARAMEQMPERRVGDRSQGKVDGPSSGG
jgi:ParB-like chromosome segregation protein Spo0J